MVTPQITAVRFSSEDIGPRREYAASMTWRPPGISLNSNLLRWISNRYSASMSAQAKGKLYLSQSIQLIEWWRYCSINDTAITFGIPALNTPIPEIEADT